MAFSIRMATLKIAYIVLSYTVRAGPFLRALMVKILKYENKRRREHKETLVLQISKKFQHVMP